MESKKVILSARVDVRLRNEVKAILGGQGKTVQTFLEECCRTLIRQHAPQRRHRVPLPATDGMLSP